MADSRAEGVLGHLHRWLGAAATATDDGRLLDRFVRQREEAAFTELVARHGPLVMGLCRRLLGNVHDAEDVFQATFFVLARKAAAIRKPESLSCWLHGVASRLALKTRSAAQRRRSHELAVPVSESKDTDLSWFEVRGLIDEELQRLPEKQRLPLVLCYLEGLTQDEASRRLGWPRGTLKRRLEAGRERLRLRLTRRGVTLGAGLFAVALTESASRAAVPLALRAATVRASIQFLTHESAAVAATPAALLAQGILQSMLTTKLKLGTMLILLFGCAMTAAGLSLPPAPPEKQPESKSEAPSKRAVEERQVRKDRYGDPLPKGATARLGTLRLRHQSMTASAVFTRDGKTAIVGDGDGFIVFWDVATAKVVRRLQKKPGVVYALAITADGKTLASASWEQLIFWDVASGKLLSQVRVDNQGIMQMLFAPDGKTLIVRGQGNTLYLWDVVGNKKLHDLTGHKGNLSCMALSPDGKTLASGSWKDPHIRLWDVASGKEKRRIDTGAPGVLSLDFRPDGKTLAAIGKGAGLAFFRPETGERLHKAKDSYGGVSKIAYAPDGKTLVGMDIHGVHILDGNSGKHLRTFDAPRRLMAGLTISPDGKTVATFWGGAHAFDLWDVVSGKLLHPAPGHRSYITALAFSADGRQVFSAAGIFDFPLQVWDARTGERRDELGDNPNSVNGLALSPDGKLLAACGYNDNTIRLWDPVSRKEVRVFKGHTAPIDSVAWSADGKMLASGSRQDKSLRIWDAATGKQCWTTAIGLDWKIAVALSPNGRSVAVGGFQNGVIRLWSAETGKELRNMTTHQQFVDTLAFSPDGSALASGGLSGAIHLWEPATGRLLRQWDTKMGWINHLVFARDGRTLVSGHKDGSVHLWEAATGKERVCFQGHRGGVRAVAISRDGRSIASGSEDTTILVWDTTGGARPDAALSSEQLQTLWRDLKDADAGRAYRAMWRMALAPKQALPFLAERLRPVALLDAARQKQVDRLLADLDSDQFAVRQNAEAELEKLGLMVEPALRKALEHKPSLEVRQRIESVLAKLANERLRLLRALEAIEHMNTPEVRRFVESLANGAPHAWLTEEARAIHKRWAE
ncbi:MAG: sigma-70 family RNA polymerase sigma factor [Gemmataceae bacterium]